MSKNFYQNDWLLAGMVGKRSPRRDSDSTVEVAVGSA
jgi:hypothetical protein